MIYLEKILNQVEKSICVNPTIRKSVSRLINKKILIIFLFLSKLKINEKISSYKNFFCSFFWLQNSHQCHKEYLSQI